MNIQEIRQKYPQYSDLSDEQLGQALHSKFYADMPYEAFAQKAGLAKQTEDPGMLSQIGRQVGLTGRAAANAVLALPAMLGDVVTGGRSTPAVGRVLDSVFPSPANATERISQDVAGGMVGGAGLAKATKTLPSILQQVLSGGGGALGSSGAREGGFGPTGQIVAGVTGGVLAPSSMVAASEGAKAVARGGKALVEPFTEQGRRNIVSRTMQSQANDPKAAAEAIAKARELIPGSIPNTAEASADTGLAALQKALRNQNPAAFSEHAGMQDAARQAFLQKTFGTKADIDAAIAARSAETGPLRDAALERANIAGVVAPTLEKQVQEKIASRISALQNSGQMQTQAAQQQVLANNFTPVPGMPRVPASISPNIDRVPEFAAGAQDAAQIAAQRQAERLALEGQLFGLKAQGLMPLDSSDIMGAIGRLKGAPGKRASDVVQKTLGSVQEKIAEFTDANGVIDARDLYTIRKEIGNTIQQFSKETANWDKRLTAGLETSVKAYIDNAIIKAGGVGWKDYLRKFSDATTKIEAQKLGQEITEKSVNPISERLSAAQFTRQIANQGEEVAGMGAQGSDALTRVAMDMRRSAAPDQVMKAAGSDTIQNLVGSNMLRRAGVTGGPVGRMTSGLLGKIYGPLETQTQGLLTQGMLDKDLGAQLLAARISENPKLAEELIRRMMMIPGAGLLGTAMGQ